MQHYLDIFDVLSTQFLLERQDLQQRQNRVLREAVTPLVAQARWHGAPCTLLDAWYDEDGAWVRIGWQEGGQARARNLSDSELIRLVDGTLEGQRA